MADDSLKKFYLSHSTDDAVHSASQFAEHEKMKRQIANKDYQNRQKIQKSLEATAGNTAETNQLLQQMIQSQNDYIKLLKQQLDN